MNKSIITKIHSRIGYWIRYERKRRFENNNDTKYRQERFILLNEDEIFMDFVPGEAICSRPTLSRIENGKVVYETTLIKFFLRRFDKKYRISEMDQRLIDSTIHTFHTYIFKNNKLSTYYLNKILRDTNTKIKGNFLWDEDSKLLVKFIEWIESFKLMQKDEFDEYYQKFKIYHQGIQDILIFYFVFSVYFNPELWSKHDLISKLIKDEYNSHELLCVFDDLFNHRPNNVFRTFYRNRQLIEDSGFLKKTIVPLKHMFENKYHHNSKIFNNLMYMNLAHKIVMKDYHEETIFESYIFSYLKHSSLEMSQDINRLLYLIKYEPYPRTINELILKQVYPKIKSKSHLQKLLNFILE
ncbi:MAG TPA: hypothetical protein VFH18_06795 [Erysipelotrichaceae bacterium]|nr:hypothetical protein [Erysipelotrichaceae bacterium]